MIKFGNDGFLTYTIFEELNEQIIILVYEVDQNEITIIQPGELNIREVTKFLMEDGVLELNFSGVISKFIRLH